MNVNINVNAAVKRKQRAQGLQTFAFCVLTVNDEHTKQS